MRAGVLENSLSRHRQIWRSSSQRFRPRLPPPPPIRLLCAIAPSRGISTTRPAAAADEKKSAPPAMNHPRPHKHPRQGAAAAAAFVPMDPASSALPPGLFPPHQMPLPPGFNFVPPPPLLHPQDDYSMTPPAAAQVAPKQRKAKNRKKKKGGPSAAVVLQPGQASSQPQPQQHQQQQQQQQGHQHLHSAKGLPARPGAPQSQLAYPTPEQMLSAQYGLQYGMIPQAQAQAAGLPPHEQQFLGQLQALIHSHHNPHHPPPPPPAPAPVAGPSSAPSAAALTAARARGPSQYPAAPTGPKPKAKRASPAPRSAHDKRSGKTEPSRASGGVPDASPAYLATASLAPFPSPQPRPLLVVIDLNGTLIHRPSRRSNPTGFVARPHADPFLHYVLTTFTTMIWSSAKPENVRSVTSRLLRPADRDRLLATWGRDAFGLTERDYASRVQCYKRLSRVWGDPAVRASHPAGGVWDQTNTVLVDDSAEKARSEPHNLIQIPEFESGGAAGAADDMLPQVHTYLNTLAMQGDVSRYMRQNPFRPQDKFVIT